VYVLVAERVNEPLTAGRRSFARAVQRVAKRHRGGEIPPRRAVLCESVARKSKCTQGSTYSPQCSDLRRGRYRHAEFPSLGVGDVALGRRGLNERAVAAVVARDRNHRVQSRGTVTFPSA